MKTQAPSRPTIIALVGLLVTMPAPAFAHSVDKRFGDFYGGMLHPLTALEHLLPLIGLSLLAGQQGAKQARWVMLALPVGLLTGAVAGVYGSPHLWIEWINRASFLLVGLAVAAAVRLPPQLLIGISFLLGISHGYENVADITSVVAMRLFLPGLVCAGLSLVTVVAAITVSRRLSWQRIAVRVVGSWITAIGLLIIASE